MRAHIVLAHPEPRSFNAHLAAVARRSLEARGWGVSFFDLYAMGSTPASGPSIMPSAASRSASMSRPSSAMPRTRAGSPRMLPQRSRSSTAPIC